MSSQPLCDEATGQAWLKVRSDLPKRASGAPSAGNGAEPQAERRGSRGEAPGAPQVRVLDTSTDNPLSPRNCANISPGGQLVLPGEPAQLGLDGVPYAPGTPQNPLAPELGSFCDSSRHDRQQLAFGFAGPVQMGFEEWRERTADFLELFEVGTGREERRAQRLRDCGSLVAVPYCKHCNGLDVKSGVRSASCGTRTCPACQREESKERRQNLHDAFRTWPYQRRGVSPMMITVTVPRKAGVSVRTLREHAELAFRGARVGYNFLEGRGAKRAYVKLEVGLSGMVHVHMLVWMPWQSPAAVAEFKARVAAVTGGKVIDLRRANKGGVRELAKYFTKGVARNDPGAKQTHPLLAAMVDIAFRGARLVREWGDWDGQAFTPPKIEPWCCPSCGCSDERSLRYLTVEQHRRELRGPPN